MGSVLKYLLKHLKWRMQVDILFFVRMGIPLRQCRLSTDIFFYANAWHYNNDLVVLSSFCLGTDTR